MANDFSSRLAAWLYARPIYGFTLPASPPGRLICGPPADASGETRKGQQILGGILACAGHKFDAARPDWFDDQADPAAIAALHSFCYLADLSAVGEPARDCARRLVSGWLITGSRPDPISWAPEVLGTRIAAWLSLARFLSDGPDGSLGRDILGSLAQQVRQLGRCVSTARDGVARLAAIRGLVYGVACGLGSSRLMNHALALLRRELARQVLEDGGHVERSPTTQFHALVILDDIRAMLDTAKLVAPQDLVLAIARLAPVLRFFRHGDGRLALFNGSTLGSANAIDAALKRSRSKAPAPATAHWVGFQRLAAGATLVIQDAGAPAPPGLDTDAHAGCLAFEMSEGRDRMIVNCGTSHGPLHDALRATAAHSTLVVGDINSTEIRAGRGLGRRPSRVDTTRDEMDGNVWVTGSHDGYRDKFGLVHQRRLYLSAAGDNLRGEDTLLPDGTPSDEPQDFVIRFHLHPDVQASLLQNGAAVLLRLPSGSGWRFQSSGGLPQLEDSVYFGEADANKRTQQIAIAGTSQRSGAVVKWAFQKLEAGR
jgi:uncharacterized heparinase superfamily protein